jgi:photosystem II stability/assembly factor-like uncharacterized protein
MADVEQVPSTPAGPKAGPHRDALWGVAAVMLVCVLMAVWVLETPPSDSFERPPEPRFGILEAGLLDVHFLPDGRRGWAVGDRGLALHTQDGGDSWQEQTTSYTNLTDVDAARDGGRAWAATADGRVLTTVDGGQRWVEASVRRDPGMPDIRALMAVAFAADARHGWAAGTDQAGRGAVAASADGGDSWDEQAVPANPGLNGIAVDTDGRQAWAVGKSGTVLATRDGGRSWQRRVVSSQEDLAAVRFAPDGRHGWAVGVHGTVLASADGGRTWVLQNSGVRLTLQALHVAADGRRVWVAGAAGVMLASSDGGSTWVRQQTPSETILTGVSFAEDGLRGWAVGRTGSSTSVDLLTLWGDDEMGTMIVTVDGGATWRARTPQTNFRPAAILFAADHLHGWMAGLSGRNTATQDGDTLMQWDGALRITGDGGHTWTDVPLPSAGKPLDFLSFAPDGRRGWAAGAGGPLLATQDGGLHWSQQALPNLAEDDLQTVYFAPDGLRGWLLGRDGSMFETADGGTTWQERHSDWLGITFKAIHIASGGRRGWMAAQDGQMLTTADGGATWVSHQSVSAGPQGKDLEALFLGADGQHGWVTFDSEHDYSDYGRMAVTSDGGATWTVYKTELELKSLQMAPDNLHGWGMEPQTLVATSDGGRHWSERLHNVPVRRLCFYMAQDGLHVWVAGSGGTVFATADGGQTWHMP